MAMDSDGWAVRWISTLQRVALIGSLVLFEGTVIFLFYRELLQSGWRANERSLILLGLFLIPAVIVLFGRLVAGPNSLLKLRLPGDVEVEIKRMKSDLERTRNQHVESQKQIENRLEETTKQLEVQIAGKLSTAEQTLYPLIGGPSLSAPERLAEGRLLVGAKDFAANIVAAELVVQQLKNAGFQCELVFPNGGTPTNYACLMNGWIDLFVDYIGTGCLFFNIDHRKKTTKQILDLLNGRSGERLGAEWLLPLGTKTDYCLVMNEDVAEEAGIDSITALAKQQRGQLRFCGNHEFMNRRDGLPGLKETYGLRFANESICAYGDLYRSLQLNEADVTVGLTTDPEIKVGSLRVLKDDQRFFPDYWETPLVRSEALSKTPGLRKALENLAQLEIESDDLTTLIMDYKDNPDSLPKQAGELLQRKKKG